MMTGMKDVLKEEVIQSVEEAEQEVEWAKTATKENVSMMIMTCIQPQGVLEAEEIMKMMISGPEEGEDSVVPTEVIGVEDSEDQLDLEEARVTEISATLISMKTVEVAKEADTVSVE